MGKVYCVVCKKKCKGDVLKINEQFLHNHCFKCVKCNKELSKDHFYSFKDAFYCSVDYKSLFSSNCDACTLPLKNEIVEILSKKFHPECFKCSSCNYSFEAGDKAALVNEKFLCTNCQKIIKKKLDIKTHQNKSQKSKTEFIINIDQNDDEANETMDKANKTNLHKTMTINGSNGVNGKTRDHQNGSSEGILKFSPSYLYNSEDEMIFAKDASNHNRLGKGVSISSMRTTNTNPHANSTNMNTATISNLGSSLLSSGTPSNLHNNHLYNRSNHSHFSYSTQRTAPPGIDYGRHFPLSYLELEERGLTAALSSESINNNTMDNNGTVSHISRKDEKIRPEKDRYVLRRKLSPGSNVNGRTLSTNGHRTVSENARNHNTLSPMSSNMYSSYHKSRSFNKNKISYRSTPNVAKNSIQVLAEKMSKEVAAHRRAFTPEVAHQMSTEAKKLATFPSGTLPDNETLPVIDRYDWPGPPSPSVVMLDRRREKRMASNMTLDSKCNSLAKMTQNNTLDSSHLSANSKSCTLPIDLLDDYTTYPYRDIYKPDHDADTLSTATMRNTSPIKTDSRIETLKRCAPKSELASALINELEAESEYKSKTGLDIISSSRSPNATLEPRYPTRYDNHVFTSPSRDSRHKNYYSTNIMHMVNGEHYDPSVLRSDYFDDHSNTMISCPSTPRPYSNNDINHKQKTLQYPGRTVSLNRSTDPLVININSPSTNYDPSNASHFDGLETLEVPNSYASSYNEQKQPFRPTIVNGRSRMMSLLRNNQHRYNGNKDSPAPNGHSKSQTDLLTPILKKNTGTHSDVKSKDEMESIQQDDIENSYDHVTGLRLASPDSRHRSRTVDIGHYRSHENGINEEYFETPSLIDDYHPHMNGVYSQLDLSNPFPSVQSWLRPSNRFALKQPKSYPKHPYEELKKIARDKKTPKSINVDRNRLEMYLDEKEFSSVFKMPYFAYQRLPLWKQNDLKLRVELLPV